MEDTGTPPGGPATAPPEAAPPPPPAPAAVPPTDVAFLVSLGIGLVAVLVLARNLLPVKQDLADTLRREERLQKEIEDLRREREVLEMREKALREDPAYIERTLRSRTGMSREGEFIVR